jgi:hypothetical protein
MDFAIRRKGELIPDTRTMKPLTISDPIVQCVMMRASAVLAGDAFEKFERIEEG